MNRERFANYDEAAKEQVTAGVIQTFGFLWNGLTSLSLTGKQDVFFRYVTRLMLMLPDVEGRNATVLDMLRLMADPAPYQRAIDALPDIPREFFARDFKSKSFEGTKEQVRYRLQAIIESPTMARLFTAPETKVDLFTEMNRGAVILVDTAKDFLKEGSAVFGKLMISLILQAVLERAAIAERDRKATFLMVDEAASYFSSNIDDLLTEARKYKCGLMLAHQYLDQASSSLRASLAANAGIKFTSGLSAQDAATMAREMRTSAEMVLSQPRLQFAAYIRNVTPSAVSIPVELHRAPPSLSDAAYAQLLERNRARVSMPVAKASPVPSEELPDEDLSTPLALPASSAKGLDVIPDLLFGLEYPNAGYRFFAVECDRNTESIDRRDLSQSAFGQKLSAYADALINRTYSSWWGLPNLHILTVTTNVTHSTNILDATASHSASLSNALRHYDHISLRHQLACSGSNHFNPY